MASNDKTVPPPAKEATISTKEESKTVTPTSDRGLAGLPSSLREAAKKEEVIQKAQVDGQALRKEAEKEKASTNKTPPSPAVCTRRYAMEMWIQIESSPGVYSFPEDDTYGADFVIDTVNMAYPGCTGVYLGEAGHVIAFFGKKGSPKAGLMLEQGMEACRVLSRIPSWMGQLAKYTVRALSLDEAKDVVAGLKRLEKENLHKARLELTSCLSNLKLGPTGSSLSASAKPFMPLATSSVVAAGLPMDQVTLPLRDAESTHPLRAGEGGGVASDTSVVSTKWQKHRNRKKNCRHRHDSEVSDSSSDASSSPSSSSNGKKKKAGVNNKVNVPDFGGKYANPQNAASAFRDWARIINHYREYYEDEYLMTQVAGSLKNDAARVFDWVRHNHHQTGDLGLILQKMRNHYSATLTFQEQRNEVENMRQASGEDAVDFLIRVSNAVQILGNDWKELMTLEEMEVLQYEVCLNGVNEDIHHVLDSETAKHGKLNSDQMYDAVKWHEAYVAHNKRLQG